MRLKNNIYIYLKGIHVSHFLTLLKINTHGKLHMIRTFFCENPGDTASIILFRTENVYISCVYGIIQRNICFLVFCLLIFCLFVCNFYTSMKLWRGYIFTAVCLCVCLCACVCVCVSVCPIFSCEQNSNQTDQPI